MALSGVTGDDPTSDDSFLVMVNAWWEPHEFTVPESLRGLDWQLELNTAELGASARALDAAAAVTLIGRSLAQLRGAGPG